MNFDTLRKANHTRQLEWDPSDAITLSYRGNELAGEVGEACNVIKKLDRERLGIRGTRSTKEALAEELADAVICLDLIAMHEGINLGEATKNKFNATSTKYGLKTLIGEGVTKEEFDPELSEMDLKDIAARVKEIGEAAVKANLE